VAGVVQQDGSDQVCHICGTKTKSAAPEAVTAHNVPVTSRPGPLRVSMKAFMKAYRRLGRLGVAAVAVGCCLMLAQCSWLTPPPAPTLSPNTSTTPQTRTITDANLITAADLPSPIGGGRVIEYHRNARTLDQLSICQPQPLETLGASSIRSRSFQARYPAGERPFPHSSQDKQPDRYAVVLQFTDQSAAERAKSIYQGWVAGCLVGAHPAKGIKVLRPSLDWTPVVVEPAQAEVAEVVYQDDESSDQNAYFESIGLTVLDDRMMITVHTFYTDESPYSVNLEEEEAGFAHPQLGMVEAAARRLSE
jgi:hypothetical protein